MDRQAIIGELKGIIGDFLQTRDLVLVDLIYRYEGRDLFLRILADRPEGGINLGECSRLNSDIGMILDEKDVLKERYILEVFSPGLDRPIISKNDFLRCLNKRARFFLKAAVEGKLEWEGLIEKIEGESVYVNLGTRTIEIPLSQISKAKQVF